MDEFTWERSVYRDKFGRIIQADELELLLRDKTYKVVEQEQLDEVFVSTVWLGVPHFLNLDHHYYFETMVWEKGQIVDLTRYENLEEAEIGHKEVVESWAKK
jgi:hypothetical protein